MFSSSAGQRCHFPSMYVFHPRSPRTSAIVAHSNGMCPLDPGNPLVASAMHAIPLVVWLRPVSNDDRVGEHNAVVCQFVYVSPRAARRLMFGVSINPPHGSIAEKPTSSRTMSSTLGAPSGAFGCSYGPQSGTESLMSMLIVPLNGLVMSASPRSDRSCSALTWQPAGPVGGAWGQAHAATVRTDMGAVIAL